MGAAALVSILHKTKRGAGRREPCVPLWRAATLAAIRRLSQRGVASSRFGRQRTRLAQDLRVLGSASFASLTRSIKRVDPLRYLAFIETLGDHRLPWRGLDEEDGLVRLACRGKSATNSRTPAHNAISTSALGDVQRLVSAHDQLGCGVSFPVMNQGSDA